MNKLDVNSDMYRIVGCALAVYNHLKPGYLESVYEEALEIELLDAGFSVRRQVRLPITYKGRLLKSQFVADMIVNDAVLVELKAVSSLSRAHEQQICSYMKSTGIKEGLLVNFGNMRRLEWRVFSPA
ncbi:MAG: GxxExxY protein [Methanocorpusculaceae archaeon]|nr:GxxExxY protein [Methanocorpusculaceae archaeon]